MKQPHDEHDGGKILVQVDPDLLDIVPGFLENRRRDVKTIEASLTRGDFETIRVLGHRMKGDGGGYGFDRISAIGNLLELAAARKDVSAIHACTADLDSFLGRVEVVYKH